MRKSIVLLFVGISLALTACGNKKMEIDMSTHVAEGVTESETEAEESTVEESKYHPTLSFDATTAGGDIVEIEIETEAAREVYHKYKWSDEALALTEYAYWLEAPEDTGAEAIDSSNWANSAAIFKYIDMPLVYDDGGTGVLTEFLRSNGIKDIFIISDMTTMEESDKHYRWDSTYSNGIVVTYYDKENKTYTFELK